MSAPDDVTRKDSAAPHRDERLATSREDVDPLIGAFLGGYRVDSELGRGGMGVVYRAFDVRLDRPVALKVVRFESVESRARFHREARAQARLAHRNVVPVHTAGEHAGLSYLVMDLIAGETLKELLQREGKLMEGRALAVADAVAAALAAARAHGLVHRDVKPSNVLVERDGHVLLTDFGLVKQIFDDDAAMTDGPPVSAMPRSLTRPGSALGTPAYAAPEQERGERVDHRADMYALGVTLHDVARELEGVSHPTRELLGRLLATRPEDRYATYDDLRAAIARARRSKVVSAPLASRAAAFVIDFFAFGLGLGILAGIARAIGHVLFDTDALRPVSTAIAWPLAAVIAGIFEAVYGTTAGKRLLHLRTIDARGGGRPGIARSIARSIVKMSPLFAVSAGSLFALPKGWAGFWLIGTGLLLGMPALGKSRTTIHDRLGRTRVILAVDQAP